jgi:hypothetical protein
MKRFIKIAVITLAVMLSTSMVYATTTRLGGEDISFNPTKSVTKTAAYTALITDSQIKVNATSGAVTITLPSMDAATLSGTKTMKIIKTDSSTNMVTIAAATGSTIGGEASRKLINQNDYIIISTGPGGTSRDWEVDYESSYLAENHYAGTVALVGGANSYNLFTSIATSTALSSANCGSTIAGLLGSALIIVTLPTSVANCKITFVNKATTASASMMVQGYAATQYIYGSVASPSQAVKASVSLTNTTATAKKGDTLSVIGDGTAWWIVSGIGQWD